MTPTMKNERPPIRFSPVEDAATPHALSRYDVMVRAIAECHRTDEVKDIHDQALALAYCARVAKNLDAERRATAIRLRAERRAGELLRGLSCTSSTMD